MAAIYTDAWYDAVRDAINSRVATLAGLPTETLVVRIEIVGDGISPYVSAGTERHFLVCIEGGHCAWYREVDADDSAVQLQYRFRGPAKVFDEIAAGIVDPVDAALRGLVKVRGDMRFLMRQAEHVAALLEAYGSGVDTEWPLDKPPYATDPKAVVGA